MDFVYICRGGDNEELRYSIRSVVENFQSLGKIWVVGSKPDWYVGNFIDVSNTSNKYNNIRNCIKAACESQDISNDFVLMNDDFFIVRKLNSVSHYHGGALFDRVKQHQYLAGPNIYSKLLGQTYSALKKEGVEEPLNYDIHTPMLINKEKMNSVVDTAYSIRSYYGNKFDLGGEQINDVKIYSTPAFVSTSSTVDNGTPFVSTEDGSFETVKDYLHNQFSEPSKYEM